MKLLIATVLCALNVIAAGAKVSRSPKVMANFIVLGVPLYWLRRLAAVQMLGVLGVALGMRWAIIGLFATVGFVAYFLGAVAVVARANLRHCLPPLLGLFLSISLVILLTGEVAAG